MTIKEAIIKAEAYYKGLKVNTALDIGEAWVFSFCGPEGEAADLSPCSVDKKTGEIADFFPPEHLQELENAKECVVAPGI